MMRAGEQQPILEQQSELPAPHDDLESDETAALLQQHADRYSAIDLDSGAPLERIHGTAHESSSVSCYLITTHIIRILSLAVLTGSILTEMKTDALTAPYIATITSGSVAGLSMPASLAITYFSNNNLGDLTTKRISVLEAFNMVLFGAALVLTGLSYEDISTDWTGLSALATIALIIMSSMMQSIIVFAHMNAKQQQTNFGLRSPATFQPTPSTSTPASSINNADMLIVEDPAALADSHSPEIVLN